LDDRQADRIWAARLARGKQTAQLIIEKWFGMQIVPGRAMKGIKQNEMGKTF
jgi:hypothetical protein